MSAGATGAAPVRPGRGRLQPLGLGDVEITGGPWAQRQQVNADTTLAHCHDWMTRLGWVGNFDDVVAADAAGRSPAGHEGMVFADSDVYKLMEAMAWEVGRSGSADADRRFVQLAATIGAAQEADGYLNTVFGRSGQRPRYSDLEWGHELYNDGHLLQAAVARARTTGEDDLVATARRVADHVCETFADGGIERVGGHPEIELGLVELGRQTGEDRYLAQAARFIERRGRGTLGEIPFGQAYFQDDVPVREATVLRGHAVRALYLTAAAVDVAVEIGDDELLGILIAQWERTLARRTYLTGGMGSLHTGEAFGDDFVLPPDRAYAETCAGIASVMLAWRLLLATGETRFADVIERTLYNIVATSPAPDGRHFFYANPLHQRVPGEVPRDDVESRRASSSLREPWFLVSCCPTNVARTFATLAAYLATTDDRGLQLHQYVDCRIATTLPEGRRVALDVSTGYPSTGVVRVRITDTPGGPWRLTLRVPPWADGATIVDPDGRSQSAPTGAAVVERAFAPGDEVSLTLPMVARWTRPDPRIDAVRGCVAVERGPLVLCAESVDLPGAASVDGLRVDTAEAIVDAGDDTVTVTGALSEPPADAWPYHSMEQEPAPAPPIRVRLIPYHRWATRGPATMRVWLPEGPK